MCGIVGLINFKENSLPDDFTAIQLATSKMEHRGPDSGDIWQGAGVTLGHRRLAILDLSDNGQQPMADSSGRYQIVYNGEVYNFKTLRDELTEYSFNSQTDTEVILAAYLTWGEDCVQRFNGIFAFAIWDSVEEELFVARDRLGIKPFYYYQDEHRFVFASEIRALLATNLVPREIKRQAVVEYLQYYSVNSPDTMITGVYQLQAGHHATVMREGAILSLIRYWSPMDSHGKSDCFDRKEVVTHVGELMANAVSRQLCSDVQLGAFLSGGIDSSAIVALMAQQSEQTVHTFSVAFEETTFDESRWAKIIAKKYKTEHHSVVLSPRDFLQQLPRALVAMDHPSGDGLNSFVVSQATKQAGFTVALSGLGGDELFAGYDVFKRYARLMQYEALYRLPLGMRKGAANLATRIYRSHKAARLGQLLSVPQNRFAHLYPVFRQINSREEAEALLGGPDVAGFAWDRVFSEGDLSRVDAMPLLSQVSVGELTTYTQNVLLRDTDQMSMAHSLEVRVPFFDNELVDFVLSVEDRHKYPAYTKQLLVEAMGDLLPHEVVHRKKMGFVFPWDQWIRSELRDFCEEKLKSLAKGGLFDSAVVMGLWSRFFRQDPSSHWMKIWMLVVLQDWIEANEIEV